jgi:Putative Ig domain
LTLNTSSGVISGTPTVAGTTNVTLGASNTAGSAAAVMLTLVIATGTTENPSSGGDGGGGGGCGIGSGISSLLGFAFLMMNLRMKGRRRSVG